MGLDRNLAVCDSFKVTMGSGNVSPLLIYAFECQRYLNVCNVAAWGENDTVWDTLNMKTVTGVFRKDSGKQQVHELDRKFAKRTQHFNPNTLGNIFHALLLASACPVSHSLTQASQNLSESSP